MDFRHLIVTCLFSKLRLPFDNQKVKENYTIFLLKSTYIYLISFLISEQASIAQKSNFRAKREHSIQNLFIFAAEMVRNP